MNEEIQCTLIEKKRQFAHGFPYKVHFQRFINGRPNLLTLPLKLVGHKLNPLVRDFNFDLTQYHHEIQIWTEHENYPPLIEIDVRLINHFTPFKFSDLSKMLPQGIWLHRKYDRSLHNSIASMFENFNYVLSSKLFPLDDPSEIQQTGDEKTEVALQNMIETKKQRDLDLAKKERNMPFSVASAKKLLSLKSEGADIKSFRNSLKKGAAKPGKKKEAKKAEPAKTE